MKTLAELKRDAKSGRMSLELTERYGVSGDDIPEKLRGIRKVVRANTVAIMLLNNDGNERECRLENAKLIEYDGETLTVYQAGYREPTEQEKAVLEGARKLYEKYADTYSGGFWQVKDYYAKSDCPWMAGHDVVKGKCYIPYSGKVLDKSLKGEAVLKYKVYMEV